MKNIKIGILVIFFIVMECLVTSAKDTKISKSKDGNKVKVGVYFEPFCPYSKDFIVNKLFPEYEKLKNTGMLDLELHPYGQNEVNMDNCQGECFLNTEIACLIKKTNKDADKYFPVIHCIMKDENPEKSAEKCLKENLPKISFKDIKKCAKVNSTSQIFAAHENLPSSNFFLFGELSIEIFVLL